MRPRLDSGVESRVIPVIPAMAETDLDQAIAVAESRLAPPERAAALMRLADALPASNRERRLALLEHVLVAARASNGLAGLVLVGRGRRCRWYEMGDVVQARGLLAEGLPAVKSYPEKADLRRAMFAARLARVDLPAALAIVDELQPLSKEPLASRNWASG